VDAPIFVGRWKDKGEVSSGEWRQRRARGRVKDGLNGSHNLFTGLPRTRAKDGTATLLMIHRALRGVTRISMLGHLQDCRACSSFARHPRASSAFSNPCLRLAPPASACSYSQPHASEQPPIYPRGPIYTALDHVSVGPCRCHRRRTVVAPEEALAILRRHPPSRPFFSRLEHDVHVAVQARQEA
jgi:hypothetical protein